MVVSVLSPFGCIDTHDGMLVPYVSAIGSNLPEDCSKVPPLLVGLRLFPEEQFTNG